MNDLISRRDVIKTIKNLPEFFEVWHCSKKEIKNFIIKAIKRQPSVNNWISVKDRLPEKKGHI